MTKKHERYYATYAANEWTALRWAHIGKVWFRSIISIAFAGIISLFIQGNPPWAKTNAIRIIVRTAFVCQYKDGLSLETTQASIFYFSPFCR